MPADVLTFELPGIGAVTARIRPQVINLLVGGEEPSYSFDLSGRLIGAFAGGENFRRGLDNRVLKKWRSADGIRQRRWLTAAEARAFLEGAYGLAERVAQSAGDPRLAVLQGWDWPALQADAARFAEVYRPVSILPPDQYLALVIQATEGCSYNRCTFCDFYRGRPFRIKGPDELRAHITAVRAFFGPAVALRKSLFLADANALVAPMPRLRAWLDVIAQAGIPAAGAGIYSFMDAFDVHRKSPDEWAELAGRGLRRVYIGMETGDDALLRWLRKPGTVADVIEAVVRLREAGIAASVIIMTGIGGERYADAHVTGTIAALNAMPLAPATSCTSRRLWISLAPSMGNLPGRRASGHCVMPAWSPRKGPSEPGCGRTIRSARRSARGTISVSLSTDRGWSWATFDRSRNLAACVTLQPMCSRQSRKERMDVAKQSKKCWYPFTRFSAYPNNRSIGPCARSNAHEGAMLPFFG